MDSAFDFTLNGRLHRIESIAGKDGVAPNTTLLEYLRASGLTGSKEGCAEGDCGACTVALLDTTASGARTYRAVHACITLLPMFAGREVVTVEGVGSREHPHPVQSAMVRAYGSQCGFCTPGFIASMFEGYYRDDIKLSDHRPAARAELADQLSGNLCRCTGYRPIRDAMISACDHKVACERRGDAPDVFQLKLRAPATPMGAVDYEANGERFLRPTTIDELVALVAKHPDAVIIAGATELGVERNKRLRPLPFLISTEGVDEMRAVRSTDEGWWLGGAATLTQVGEGTAGALPSLNEMLTVFAARQVRNRATLAGNLVTASPIGDMAPVLLSLDAEMILRSVAGERRVPLSTFFTGYRKTVLARDEVVVAVLVPHPSRAGLTRRTRAFKVSKRRELDISIVAAGFCIDVDDHDVIRHARLAYGGVAATPARATEAEVFLVGRQWSEATLEGVLPLLDRTFAPIDDARSGRIFRRDLVGSLFEKFFRDARSEVTDGALDYVEGRLTEDTSPSVSLRHDSAWGHVTGDAIYVDDQASRRGGFLEMWPVMSEQGHGKLVSVDVAAARAMPGVVDVITAADIPGDNDVGAVRKDEPLLANGEVLFRGQMIAVVIGSSLHACRAAAAKVVVVIEPLPAIYGIAAAIEAQSFHTQPHVIARGEADTAIASSAHTLSGELDIGGQEHFYLEAQAVWAERGDDDDLFLCSSTQHPSEIQAVVSHVMHMPRNKIVVQSPRMGGGFGGKETQGNGFAALAALASWRAKRPVRVQLDRDVDMELTGKRHPFYARFHVGFGDDGVVNGARVSLVSDGGYALDLSESILDRALFHLDNSYYLPAVRFEGRVAKTNVTSHTAFRGFGGPQGMVVIEEILDRIARTLGLPPEVVRERNLYRGDGASNTTHYGQLLDDNRIERVWSKLVDSSKVHERRRLIDAFNRENKYKKRGIAMTPVKFGISFTASFLNQAGAHVLIYRDGTVQVNHGGTEMGQGINAKMHGIVMRALGLPSDRIRVMKTQTDKVPNTSATAASSGADLNGAAVLAACETLKERLATVAATMVSAGTSMVHHAESMRFEDGHVFSLAAPEIRLPFASVTDHAHLQQVSLATTGFYRTPGLAYDKKKGHGRPFHYFAYGAAVTEVEIDGHHGMKRVRRVDIVHDVGDSLNPAIDRGQIEGAFVQGMGWLTAEELKWSTTPGRGEGRLLSHSASTYMIPSIGDAPAEMHVELLDRAPQPGVIHGSKAVGEPPLMLALSVREAIRDAVAAFGGEGIVALPCPATHEAIFAAIRARIGDAKSMLEGRPAAPRVAAE